MAWVERPERLGTGPSKITDLAVVDANVAHPDGSARDLNRVWPDTDQPPPLTETSFGPDELRRFRYPYTRERIWRRARMARCEKPTQRGDGLACQQLIGSVQPGGLPNGPAKLATPPARTRVATGIEGGSLAEC